MLNTCSAARRFRAIAMVLLGIGFGGICAAPAGAVDLPSDAAAPPVVTDDIRVAIEKHIAAEVARGDGHFNVIHDDDTLGLRLVRVHVEYLATLGPREHFACVDMASEDGQFYDIDFFMEGDPGAMDVTRTMVHKLNGRPYYLWEQNADGLWVRATVADADGALLGVLTGQDAFTFRYQATLPAMTADARCWIPLAGSDAFQKVTVKSVRSPRAPRTLTDDAHGNQVLFLELTPADSGEPVEIVYDVVRIEKSAYVDDPAAAARYLQPEAMVPADASIKALAEAAVAGRQGDLARARALYDHVMDEMRYMKFGEGWGRGDAVRACDSRYGNCTDYHAYFIGLARAVGIPARFAIGAAIPSERDNGGTDGYHCWAEFHAEGKWWPVDISEADKYSSLSSYFFGHHPANRIEFSRGRDLVLDPGPASGPINFLAYPLLEVGGAVQPVKTLFLFERRS
jgi:transglutaminase-like putative cysteine protease